MALYPRRQKTLHIERCDRSYMLKQIWESKRDEVWHEDYGLVFGRSQIQTSAQRRDTLVKVSIIFLSPFRKMPE
jgi:hypothetical protein